MRNEIGLKINSHSYQQASLFVAPKGSCGIDTGTSGIRSGFISKGTELKYLKFKRGKNEDC